MLEPTLTIPMGILIGEPSIHPAPGRGTGRHAVMRVLAFDEHRDRFIVTVNAWGRHRIRQILALHAGDLVTLTGTPDRRDGMLILDEPTIGRPILQPGRTPAAIRPLDGPHGTMKPQQ